MDPGKALADLLKADADVAAFVKKRVFPRIMPETEQYPLLVYTRISDTPLRVLAGPAKIKSPRYQIDVWSQTDAEAVELADAVQAALDGYVGRIEDVAVTISFQGGQAIFDEGSGLYHNTVDVLVMHEVAA
jgi:hypothetical protein